MNITTQTATSPLATVVNQPTDSLRRENTQREIISQPTPTHQSAAEKGVASERERARTPAQMNEQIDFAAIQKNAEKESSSINDARDREQGDAPTSEQEEPQSSAPDHDDQHGEHQKEQELKEQQEIHQLQKRDQEVRAHERAHDSAGGSHTGSPSYGYEVGPDGKKYAVSGEVSVDLSPIQGNPKATITKMQKIHAAALAPVSPSSQDIKVAASAQATISQLQSELRSSTIGDSESEGNRSGETHYTGRTDTFRAEEFGVGKRDDESSEYDQLMSQTLSAQEQISSTRDAEITQRASRIETFYSNINQAYAQGPSFQFELTA